jgi:hypothetical protein
MVDATNDFTIAIGELARSAPDAPSPYFDATNNRDALLIVAGQTYQFIPFTPLYHLAAPILDGNGAPTGFRESSAAAIAAWFANASLHQSMREAADFDALLCGAAPLPIDAPLQRITVPLFYLGAAGGFGTAGYFSTAATSSRDITKLNIQRLADNRTAEDFGHGDLLYSPAAATAAWLPLATWLRHH